jgi:DmsE family decaheme c-type cytochrome
MNSFRQLLTLCAALAALGVGASSWAADAPAPGKKVLPDLFLTGDGKCTSCHDEADAPKVLTMGKTRHGTKADGRTPTCTSCHGESEAHMKSAKAGGKNKPTQPDVTFSKKSKTTVEARNEACLSCHQRDAKRMLWSGSTHESQDVACTSCHEMHTGNDKVRDKRTQPDVCFNCHKEQRTQINKPSHHPIPEAKMGCADCHNVHGSAGPKLMKRDSVNETCYTCHMEKRGPFVHNHEPVSEDCSNCHNPHGTTAENLLKMRPPFLCHQCHTPHGGFVAQTRDQAQASAITATSGGKQSINFTQGRGCLNCHTQVHGSNNPDVGRPAPQLNFR